MDRKELDLAERKQRAFRIAKQIEDHAEMMQELARQLMEEVSHGGATGDGQGGATGDAG